jgi:hypothetical protein
MEIAIKGSTKTESPMDWVVMTGVMAVITKANLRMDIARVRGF